MSDEYRIERDKYVGPWMDDFNGRDEIVARVFRKKAPFAYGEVVAFFVGEDAERQAQEYIEWKNELVTCNKSKIATLDTHCPSVL